MNLKQEQEQTEWRVVEHEGTQVQLGLGQLEKVLCTGFYRGEEVHGRPTMVVGQGPPCTNFSKIWLST